MSKQQSIYHQSANQIATEHELIKLAVDNPQRFEPLYNKYFLAIYKYILVRVEDPNVTDEIVSNVFAKALHKLDQYKFKGLPFGSWLYRIAYNEMNDSFRKKKASRTVQVPSDQFHLIAEQEVSSSDEDREHLLKLVIEGIRRLKAEEVELIELRYFERRPFKEIAEILSISEDNAKVKTHRIIKKLKQELMPKKLH